MRSSAVLFRGSDKVLKAYERVDIPAWALCNGKDIIFSFSGENQSEGYAMLKECLNALEENDSQAILHLRVYDELKGKITSATPYSNSFPFALFDPEDGMVHMPRGKSVLLARISALEEQLQKKEEEDDQVEEKPSGFMGKIGQLLERPEIQDRLVQAAIGAIQNIFGQSKLPATMAGIPGAQTATAPQTEGSMYDKLSADQQNKLREAMELLMARDPQIGDHLLKLAKIPDSKYKMALTFL